MTPEEEFDALAASEDEFDKLGAPQPAGATPVSSPEDIPPQEYPSENGRPWYDRGVVAGARRGVMGNLGNELAGALLPQREEIDGIPATYAGQTPGASLEQNFQEERAANPGAVLAGQLPVGIATGVAAGALAGLAGGAMAPTIGGATVPLTAPAAIGGGALPFLAETYAEQQGDVGQRLSATEQYTREHPVQTTVAAAAPFVAEAAAPMLKAGGKKLIDAGNRGLARVGLGPAEVARIRSLGLEKLTDFGAKMRSAGLDKPRDILQRFSPTDARRISDNAADIIGGQGGKISKLEDDIMNTLDFGRNEIDPAELTRQLRSAVRKDSAATGTPKRVRAMEKQAQKFDPQVEEVPVSGSIQMPPPLPRFNQPQLPPDFTPAQPVQGDFGFAPPTPKPAPALPAPVQGRLDLAQQQNLPLPATPAPAPAQYNTQGELPLTTQLPLPGTGRVPVERPVYPTAGVASEQTGLPLETQGELFRPETLHYPTAGVAPKQVPVRDGQLDLQFPQPLAPQRQGALPLEQQLPLPTPPRDPYVPGPLPTEQMSLPGLGGSQQALPLPAPEPLPPWQPGDLRGQQTGLDIATQMPLALPPGGRVMRGEFPKGGTTQPLEATAQVYKPYTVQRAKLDQRDIGNQLFDKKQRLLASETAEDEASMISWRWLKDRFQQELDKAVKSGQLAPKQVENYRKASQDFSIAADVQVDAARRAEQDLRRAAGFWKGGAEAARDSAQGTQYNLGRLLKGVGDAARPITAGGVGAMSPAQQQDKNDQMKQELFEPWYNKLVGADQ